MPELGKYAAEVGIAYAASIVLILLLVAVVWARARKIRRALRDLEARRTQNG